MVIRNMRGTTSAAAATIRAVGAGQRQGSCDHAGGLRSRVLRTIRNHGETLAACEDAPSCWAKTWADRPFCWSALGAPMYDIVADPVSRHNLLCEVAVRLWRPIGPDIDLPTGAKLAEQYADRLPRLWEQAGRPCSPATVADALDCMNRRRLAHDDRSAVLVHGDIHEMNALQASDGSYKLIDPAGLRAEPACDLGTIVRCNPDLGDDLWARTEQLASRTGVDATAIWEWGTIHRVVSGVYACSIGFQPFGDLLLAEADRLTA